MLSNVNACQLERITNSNACQLERISSRSWFLEAQ
jgi:hypothetical protein